MGLLELVVGAGVVTREASIDAEAWSLTPDEAAHVAGAHPLRRREFAAGRVLARRAMAELGVPVRSLLVGPGRGPLWPPGVVGSISHTRRWCGAAAARAREVRAIGIDGEHSLDAASLEAVLAQACRPAEHDFIHRAADARERALRAALVFSAKESVYKCRFPVCSDYLDYLDVEVEVDVEVQAREATGRFTVHLATRPPRPGEPAAWPGRFAVGDDDLVVTAVVWPR